MSPVFPKNTDLILIQTLFAEELAQTEHAAVQCPVSKYPSTIRVMREDAVEFNRKVGNAIVSLDWEPFSLPTDEDPIEAVIYTGNSSSDQAQDHSGWRYCFARSGAENKTYFTPAFPKASTLYADEKEFASKLNTLKFRFDSVQCPNSLDQSSISAMRDSAITFNQQRGETIVTLNWDSET